MKLSEMTTDAAAEMLCEIAEPVERICCDKALNAHMGQIAKEKDKMTVMEMMGKTIAAWFPALLKEHKEDVYKVLSAMTGKTEKEIAEQKIMETIADVKACVDDELMLFFKSLAGMA